MIWKRNIRAGCGSKAPGWDRLDEIWVNSI